MIWIKNSIPPNSRESAKVATVFNILSRNFVYPDIQKFMKMKTKIYLYYIQDLKTNSLIGCHVNINKYDDLTVCYSKSLSENSYLEREKIDTKAREIVLDILLEILNIEDSHKWTRALAISEQINYNYDESDDSDDTTNSESEEELISDEVVSVNFNNDSELGSNIVVHHNPLFQAAMAPPPPRTTPRLSEVINTTNETIERIIDNLDAITNSVNSNIRNIRTENLVSTPTTPIPIPSSNPPSARPPPPSTPP